MTHSRSMTQLSVIMAAFLISNSGFALKYEFECQQGKLTSFQSDNPGSDTEPCRSYLRNGYAKCFDSQKPPARSENITISTPVDHYYKSKESNLYQRSTVTHIIDQAVRHGVDPYMALSLVLLENPPTQSRGSNDYARRYGTLPLDSVGAADLFNCQHKIVVKKFERHTTHNYEFIGGQNPVTIRLDDQGVATKVCAENTHVGGSPYWTRGEAFSSCCGTVHLTPGLSDHEMSRRLTEYASWDYIKKRLNFAKNVKTRGMANPYERIAMIGQAYNGYGVFGVSERMSNNCLHLVDFNKTPIYGAGAAELMLNSLMANSEIRQIVQTSARKYRTGVSSLLCDVHGNGRSTIDGLVYSNLMKSYTEGRRGCPQLSYNVKGFTPQPSPQQQKIYSEPSPSPALGTSSGVDGN